MIADLLSVEHEAGPVPQEIPAELTAAQFEPESIYPKRLITYIDISVEFKVTIWIIETNQEVATVLEPSIVGEQVAAPVEQ